MKLEYILEASPIIQIHLGAALIALAMGVVMWFRPKGTKGHKFIGRGFLFFLIITAVSAVFIREINQGQFSFIHLFVPLTLFGAWQAVTRIRRKDIVGHKRSVKGMFFGALLVPGLFAFMPGRHLWKVFFG